MNEWKGQGEKSALWKSLKDISFSEPTLIQLNIIKLAKRYLALSPQVVVSLCGANRIIVSRLTGMSRNA